LIVNNGPYPFPDENAPSTEYSKMLELRRKGYTYREIAKKYGCSNQTVRDAVNAEELVKTGVERDFGSALKIARRLRKASYRNMEAEAIFKAITMRLEGSSLREISRELNVATVVLGNAINLVIWAINQQIHRIGPIPVRNKSNRRFVRFENVAVYPTDPPDLKSAIKGLVDADKKARDAAEFDALAEKLIFEFNQRLKNYRVKLWKRQGSPSERKGRPFAIRLKRFP